MAIPKTRTELTDQIVHSFDRLNSELRKLDAAAGNLTCVDDWSVKDLLAVRAWWTERVVAWIEAGRAGQHPKTPAPGYRWSETPRLNRDLITAAREESLADIIARLRVGFERVVDIVARLDDRELLEPGVFSWTGKLPVARWISINTARQYTTARTYIRRAQKALSARLNPWYRVGPPATDGLGFQAALRDPISRRTLSQSSNLLLSTRLRP